MATPPDSRAAASGSGAASTRPIYAVEQRPFAGGYTGGPKRIADLGQRLFGDEPPAENRRAAVAWKASEAALRDLIESGRSPSGKDYKTAVAEARARALSDTKKIPYDTAVEQLAAYDALDKKHPTATERAAKDEAWKKFPKFARKAMADAVIEVRENDAPLQVGKPVGGVIDVEVHTENGKIPATKKQIQHIARLAYLTGNVLIQRGDFADDVAELDHARRRLEFKNVFGEQALGWADKAQQKLDLDLAKLDVRDADPLGASKAAVKDVLKEAVVPPELGGATLGSGPAPASPADPGAADPPDPPDPAPPIGSPPSGRSPSRNNRHRFKPWQKIAAAVAVLGAIATGFILSRGGNNAATAAPAGGGPGTNNSQQSKPEPVLPPDQAAQPSGISGPAVAKGQNLGRQWVNRNGGQTKLADELAQELLRVGALDNPQVAEARATQIVKDIAEHPAAARAEIDGWGDMITRDGTPVAFGIGMSSGALAFITGTYGNTTQARIQREQGASTDQWFGGFSGNNEMAAAERSAYQGQSASPSDISAAMGIVKGTTITISGSGLSR